jgi:hypothetical protein
VFDQFMPSVAVGKLARFHYAQESVGREFGRRGGGEIGDGAQGFGKFCGLGAKKSGDEK